MRLEISFNICRICLQNTNDDMSSIYEPIIGKDGVNEILYHRIERCGGIEVLTNPELPNKICKRCNVFLNIAYKFRTICKSSDKYLREFCQTSRHSDVADFDKDVYGDDGEVEYLLDCNPEPSNSVAQVLQQAGHDIDESQTAFNYEEIDEYSDMMNDNENEQQRFAAVDRKISPTSEILRRSNCSSRKALDRSSRMALDRSSRNALDRCTQKTLDISSDGAAVIRVKSHRFLKHEKQIHICDVCGNTYNRKYALDAHMRRHRNEKPFECEICQKAFHLNFQLTRHIRKHTGARPYNCQYCNRSFADRSTMVKHERIHRNERPYTCDTCGKSFTYSNVLKVHMLTHTGERPFICGICDKRFSRAHHLRAHLETLQHQGDPRSKLLLKQIKRVSEQSYGDE